MKTKSNPFLRLSAIALLGFTFVMSSAQATPLYWDSNGTTAGAGTTPTGTWGTSNFWSTDSTGVANAFQTTTTASDDLQLVAGPAPGTSGSSNFSVTVSGTQAANKITFLCPTGSPTLTGGTINLGAGGITVPRYYTGTTDNANRPDIVSTLNLTADQTWTIDNLTNNSSLLIDGNITGTGNITEYTSQGNGAARLSFQQGSSAGWTGALTVNGGGVYFGNSQQMVTRLNSSTLTLKNGGTTATGVSVGLDLGSVTNFTNNIAFSNTGSNGYAFGQGLGGGFSGAAVLLSGTISGVTNGGQVLFSTGTNVDFSGVGQQGQWRISGNNTGWTSTRTGDAVYIRSGYLYLDSANAIGTNNSLSVQVGQGNGGGQCAAGLFASNGITVTSRIQTTTNAKAGALTGEAYVGLDGTGAATFSSAIALQNVNLLPGASGNNLHLRAQTGGTVTFSGNFSDSAAVTTWSDPVIVDGTGTVVMTGSSLYYGNTIVNAGTLKLDFSARAGATNVINSTANRSALVLGGGTLNLTGKASTTNSQQFNGTTLNAGSSGISLTANATANPLLLTLGTLTRNAAAAVDFTL
ncbi:MAG: hypothetical protein WCJ14_09715, partial [Verrucomicrobiota bacterium]